MSMHSLQPFLNNARVLVVDDFAKFRQTIRTMLLRIGVSAIDQASNGAEAVRLCQENQYQIIFCDYNLGEGKDGQQVLEELHHRKIIEAGTLFLMVTAETTSAQVKAAIEYRPDTYLTKPFTTEQLQQRLKRLIEKNEQLKPVHKALNQNNRTRAVQLCDELMAKKPALRFSLLRIKSDILLKAKQWEACAAIYQQVAAEQPLLWAEIGMGQVKYLQGDAAAALQHFQGLVERFPGQVSVIDWIAKCQKALGNHEEAEQSLLEAIKISPKSVSRQAELGELAHQLEHHDVAYQAYRETVTMGNDSCLLQPEHYRQFFANASKEAEGKGGIEQGKMVAGVEVIASKMSKKYHSDPTALASNLGALAGVYATTGRNSKADDSILKLNKTLQDPNCLITHEDFAEIQKDLQTVQAITGESAGLKKFAEQAETIEQKIGETQQRDQSAKDINREGLMLSRQGEHLKALEKFRQATEIMPQYINYKLNAAQILLTEPSLKGRPESIAKAREYLDSMDLEHAGLRWQTYQTLKSQLPDE